MSTRDFVLALLLILAVVAALIITQRNPTSVPAPKSLADLTCRVDRVTDGDTLRCKDGTRIRLHAISARERDNSCSLGHPCPTATAQDSTRALKALVQGETLDCMTTGESYNRVTAICWTSKAVEVNCHMVQSGAAALWERYAAETPLCRKVSPST